MTRELFTIDGKRKYLTQEEQERFLKVASDLDRPEIRTLCMTLVYTGCRISEALALTIDRIDLSAKAVSIKSLKKRDKINYRTVPVPDEYLDAMKLVHHIQKFQNLKDGGKDRQIWKLGRTMAWKHIRRVMAAAEIQGAHASPKGLRHGFGVRMAQKTRNPRLIQKLLGHASLETTAIYMDLVGEQEREEVIKAW